MGGGGKGKTEYQVAEYYLSVDFGICHGPIDSLNEIWIKEKIAWEGRRASNGTIDINQEELFGGRKKEGGVAGSVDVYLGTATQTMTATSALRYGLDASDCPGYRGIAHLMFRGSSAGKGFLWVSNNPYLPAAWAGITRIPKGWMDEIAAIPLQGRGHYLPINSSFRYAVYEDATDDSPALPGFDDSGWAVGQGPFGSWDLGEGLDPNTDVSVPEDGAIWLRFDIPATENPIKFLAYHDNLPRLYVDGVLAYEGSLVDDRTTEVVVEGSEHARTVAYAVENTGAASFAAIEVLPDENAQANPAHMIRECLTNDMWGLGHQESDIGDSFVTAAQTLFDEAFGLTMTWTQQSSVEAVIQEICDHIQGMVYIDMETGLWELVLIRDDYEIGDLVVLDPSNCTASNRQRKALSETTNEIVVKYTDPDSHEESSVVFQDIANMAMQGGTRSESRDYYGIRSGALAQQVGARDLRAASYPMFSCDLVADTTVGKLKPGQVVVLNWPDDDLYNMVLRVYRVDYGKPGSSSMKLTVTEDVFGLGAVSYDPPEGTLDDSGVEPPEPIGHLSVVTTPLPLLLRSGYALSDVDDGDYPAVTMATFGNTIDGEVDSIRLTAQVTKPNAEVVEEVVAEVPETPLTLTQIEFDPEATSVLSGDELRTMLGVYVEPETGDFIQLGMTDLNSEIVMLYSYDEGDDEYVIARGIFDTIPRAWPVGTPVWYLGTSLSQLESSENASGTADYYKSQTVNGAGVLDAGSMTTHAFTPTDRPYAPHRPANVSFGGHSFPADTLDFESQDPIAITWANRDRLGEDVVAPRWDDVNVTPEVGQETNIVLLDPADGSEVNRITGVTGTSYNLTHTEFLGHKILDVRVVAVRDGFESVQAMQARILVSGGYGYSYGFNYGGAT